LCSTIGKDIKGIETHNFCCNNPEYSYLL